MDDDDDTAVVWLLACLLGGFCQEKSLLLFFSKTDQKVMLALDGINSSSSSSFTGPNSSTHSTKDTVTALNKSKYPKVYTCGTFIWFQGSLCQSVSHSLSPTLTVSFGCRINHKDMPSCLPRDSREEEVDGVTLIIFHISTCTGTISTATDPFHFILGRLRVRQKEEGVWVDDGYLHSGLVVRVYYLYLGFF